MKPINLFYQEPNPDRWFKYDRYLRGAVRRIVRGKPRPGGVMMVAINLMKGLKKIGKPFRLNDFNYIEKHPDEIACIIGKPHVLFERKWHNPIILGAGIFSHPIERPNLLIEYPKVKRVLVPGDWMRVMFEPYYHNNVVAWPTGIDTDKWFPKLKQEPKFDFLIYDKIRWEHHQFEENLIDPICKILDSRQQSYQVIRYGSYKLEQLNELLSQCTAVIFLCEHETQGLAYQQMLSTGTPILAWDRGGYWQDPYYYPHKVKFKPVSSVPYWDERCGLKFTGLADFESQLTLFLSNITCFKPRDYILENLSLEVCAKKYLEIYGQVQKELF